MIIYGIHPVLSFLKYKPKLIKKVYVSQNINLEKIDLNIKVQKIPNKDISVISKTNDHQGICAELEFFPYSEFQPEKYNTVCILDHIEDPRNLGAILRNALAFNIDSVIIPKERACEITSAAIKASAGAAAVLSISKVTNINQAITELKDFGFWVYGFEANGTTKLSEVSFDKKSVIVLGSEGKGISSLTKKRCDFIISVDMVSAASSLNVSSCSAIVFYQRFLQERLREV